MFGTLRRLQYYYCTIENGHRMKIEPPCLPKQQDQPVKVLTKPTGGPCDIRCLAPKDYLHNLPMQSLTNSLLAFKANPDPKKKNLR